MLTITEKNPKLDAKEGDVLLMRWIPESRIPKHHVQDIRKHVDRLAKENDLGQVKLRWFRAAEDRALMVTRKNGEVVDVATLDEPDRPAGSRDADFWAVAGPMGTSAIAFVTPSFPNTISLYATLRGDELPHVVAHEVRHLVQQRDVLAGDAEADADAYGADYLRRSA